MKAVLHRSSSAGLPLQPRPPRLWSRFVEWAARFGYRQDMSQEWSCCGTPMLDPMVEEMGRPDSFSLTMYRCSHCGARWLGAASLAPMTRQWQFIAPSEGRESGQDGAAPIAQARRMPPPGA